MMIRHLGKFQVWKLKICYDCLLYILDVTILLNSNIAGFLGKLNYILFEYGLQVTVVQDVNENWTKTYI